MFVYNSISGYLWPRTQAPQAVATPTPVAVPLPQLQPLPPPVPMNPAGRFVAPPHAVRVKGFIERMIEFKMPIHYVRDCTENASSLELLGSTVYNSYGMYPPRPQETQKIADDYKSQFHQLAADLEYFKDHPLDLTQLDTRILIIMLTRNIWKGEQKDLLEKALQESIGKSPDTVYIPRQKRFFLNHYIEKDNYHIVFDYIDCSKLSEEEKITLLKRLIPNLLLNPDTVDDLAKKFNESHQSIILKIQQVVSNKIDVYHELNLNFCICLQYATFTKGAFGVRNSKMSMESWPDWLPILQAMKHSQRKFTTAFLKESLNLPLRLTQKNSTLI